MTEVAVVLLGALVVFAVGYPLARWADRRHGVLLAPPLGLALVTILSTALYVLNWPARTIQTVVLGLALACAIWAVARLDVLGRLRREAVALALYGGVLALLCAPALVGGEQFTVFQGNTWDHFSYLSGALAYSKYTYAEVLGVTRAAILDDPLKLFANLNLEARPSVFLLFALVIARPVGGLSTLAYVFVASLLSLSYFSLLYLLRVTVADADGSPRRARAAAVVAAVFPLGFWGQYVLDINAWSQAGSISLLAAFLALSVRAVQIAARREPLGAATPAGLFVALAAVLAGAVLVYPESALVHVAAAVAAVSLGWLRGTLRFSRAALLMLLLSAGLLGGLVHYGGSLGFVLRQARFGVSANPHWWFYFHRFLLGRDGIADLLMQRVPELSVRGAWPNPARGVALGWLAGHLAERAVWMRLALSPLNLLLGVAGLYFLTIPATYPLAVIVGWTAVAVVVVYGLARLLTAAERMVRAAAGAAVAHYQIVFLGALAAVVILLLALGQIWSAGKALSILAPYLTTMLALPLVAASWRRDTAAAALYAALAVGFAVYRIAAVAGDAHGAHYRPPYPALMHPGSKEGVRWGVDADRLKRCSAVKVEGADPFVRHYLTLQVVYAGRNYYHEAAVRASFGFGPDLGRMPAIPVDCTLSAVESGGTTTLVLRSSPP